MRVHIQRVSAWILCLPAMLAKAHDFWVQPVRYRIPLDYPVAFTLEVGHGPFRQRSPISAQRIVRFDAIAPGGATTDLSRDLRLGGATDDGAIVLHDGGTYVLVLQTDDRAQSHLPSIRFNDYLNVEGLTPALEQRARLHRTDADGSERYSRVAKSLLQVGAGGAQVADAVTKPLGLPLEIVPEANPYGVPRPSTVAVRVLYEGQPLAGGLVKLTNLEHDASPLETHRTDESGRVSFAMPDSGTWLVNVIWTKASPASDDTDFETVFSSLSFGFSDARP